MKTEVDVLYDFMVNCEECILHETRTQVVCGRGHSRYSKRGTKLLFIGEAPGQEEDEEGEPFVGRSGYILEMWIEWLGMDERDWFISNIVKCRPPDNRDPKADEIAACSEEWLYKEVKYINPWVIVPVGRIASAHFLGKEYKTGITDYAGDFYLTSKTWKEAAIDHKHRLVYPILHPSWFIRKGQGEKEEYWSEQLEELRRYLLKMEAVK